MGKEAIKMELEKTCAAGGLKTCGQHGGEHTGALGKAPGRNP